MVKVYALNIVDLTDPICEPQILFKLPEARRKKIMKLIQPKDRKLSLGAGLLLEEVFQRRQISDKNIYIGKHGKPETEHICFNLSHSGEIVICSVSSNCVGCDVERIHHVSENIAEHFFCESERRYLDRFSGEKKQEEFFRLWTIKESYMKMTGEGMSLPLNEFEVDIQKQVTIRRSGKMQSCFIKEYVWDGYKIAVCAEEREFAWQMEWMTVERGLI